MSSIVTCLTNVSSFVTWLTNEDTSQNEGRWLCGDGIFHSLSMDNMFALIKSIPTDDGMETYPDLFD